MDRGMPVKFLLIFALIFRNINEAMLTVTTQSTEVGHQTSKFMTYNEEVADDEATIDEHFMITNDNFLQQICMFLNISMENCDCGYLEKHHANLTGICTPVVHETVCLVDNSLKAQAMFSVVASFIGIIGNSIVLMVRSKSTVKSLHYRLIMGLAAADLLFSIAQAVYYMPLLIVGCKWIYGRCMCSILPSLLGISSAVDVGFIVTIAAERYSAIVQPLKKAMSPHHIYALTAINVIIGVCSVIPMFMVFEVTSYGACTENWSKYPNGSLIYSWMLLIFLLVLPVVVTTVLYCRSLKAITSTYHPAEVTVSDGGVNKVQFTTKLMSENKRVLLLISSLLMAFVLLNSPNRIVWLIIDHIGYQNLSYDLYKGLKIFGIVPYSLHIMINPIIYSVVDKRFRNNVVALFKGKKRRLLDDSSQTINLIFDTSNV